MWVPITEDNVRTLKAGEEVRFSNGYEWSTAILDEFWIERGYVPTGLHNETARFIRPMFGGYMYVWRPVVKAKEKNILRMKMKLLEKSKQEHYDSETPNYGREFSVICPDCEMEQIVTKKLITECQELKPPPYAIQVFVASCGGFASLSFHCTHCQANFSWSEDD